MRVLVSMLDLKQNERMMEEYLTAHKNVEPAIMQCMDRNGIILAQVRRCGNRLAQIVIVNDDFDDKKFNEDMNSDPACIKWNEDMMLYQQKVPSAKPTEWWADSDVAFEFHNWSNQK